MRATRSGLSSQRRSQRTRKQALNRVEDDFYDCPRCRKLFARYHGSHKRHIKSCEAKYAALEQEEGRLWAERIETPTPDPYTPVCTDAEIDTASVAEPSSA